MTRWLIQWQNCEHKKALSSNYIYFYEISPYVSETRFSNGYLVMDLTNATFYPTEILLLHSPWNWYKKCSPTGWIMARSRLSFNSTSSESIWWTCTFVNRRNERRLFSECKKGYRYISSILFLFYPKLLILRNVCCWVLVTAESNQCGRIIWSALLDVRGAF